MARLPRNFPFRAKFKQFLDEYASCTTYWYVPKTRVLNDENVGVIQDILKLIFDEFLDAVWNPDTQDRILRRLNRMKVLEPYKPEGTKFDRTALVRIWKKMIESLGLLWVQDDKEIVITDAGLDVIAEENPRPIIERQIAKLQYPNPSLGTAYSADFKGLLPHLFLLQVLKECDYRVTSQEYELFVNLAQCQSDVERIVNYTKCWRDLKAEEQELLLKRLEHVQMKTVPSQIQLDMGLMPSEEVERTRFNRLHLNSSYQRPFYAYPGYLELVTEDEESFIGCKSPDQIEAVVREQLRNLKIPEFRALEDWFAYYGDPKQAPSWFTYLSLAVEQASTEKEAVSIVEQHREQLTPQDQKEIEKKQIEKKIEDFWVQSLEMLEEGLVLLKGGRQYSTPIGRIDLLCRSSQGEYVVIEIKAGDANDSVFDQILRYIGWVHRNMENARNNVRGIILAGKFPESARYSRIGLLKKNYRTFLKFKEHGLYVSDI
jgi:hypothetical protein